MLAEHLGLAGNAEHATQPFQLVAQLPAGRLAQHYRERLQRAAQPPGGHPHLVDRVGFVPADRRDECLEPGRVRVEISQHDLARR